MRQAQQLVQMAAEEGIRTSRFDYRFAVDEIDRVLTGEPFSPSGESALWADATRKVAALVAEGRATDSESEDLLEDSRQAMLEEIAPGYRELRANRVATRRRR